MPLHSLIAQLVKNPPAIQETQVQFLGWEGPLEKGTAFQLLLTSLVAQLVNNPLEKGTATHSSILA